ncbi:putative chromatin remodeling & transcription regulator BTB-POZ family [Helianthus debilis subsp. tardiflorus]
MNAELVICLTEEPDSSYFPPDVTFYLHGRPIEAHRVILSASLVHFFYSDRLEIAVDDMECKVCKCESLEKVIEKEVRHQKYTDYKSLQDIDNSQRRYILQGSSLPEEDRLPAALSRIIAYMEDFLEGKDGLPDYNLPLLINEHDLSMEAFEKMIEYMYTDGLKEINPEQAEQMFDAASRYLLFPLKRAVADALLPVYLIYKWYGVLKIREYCLDMIACNFERFADTEEFRAMLLTLPPPSGDSSLRTIVPNAPGAEMKMNKIVILHHVHILMHHVQRNYGRILRVI